MSDKKVQKLLHITTFGCQMNDYDSGRLAALLTREGYTLTRDKEAADLILLNTCSVREKPEHKVYSFLGSLKEIKKENPNLIVGVAGCVAQQEGEKLLKKVPLLNLVFGPGEVENVAALVKRAQAGERLAATSLGALGRQIEPELPPDPGLKSQVTIMQGCNNFCTYCVVPYVRGREYSRPAETVLAEARGMVEKGTREIMLLGQNVNSYNDAESGLNFPQLLRRVAEIPGLWRVRFTTSHPKDFSPELIEVMAEVPQVMESLHLPAQSGSNRMLKAMNRRYTREHYLDRVELLKKNIKIAALGTDLIVGFPGETEDDFADTLELVRQVRYDYSYSFKYSDRPFAKAADFEDKVPEEVKSERLARLQELQTSKSLELHRELVGRKLEVLVEGPAKRGEALVTGRSRAGRAVNFPGHPSLFGTLVTVEITEARINSLMGRLVKPAQGE
ncbi:tRNA (N6-isopentenyl adenosine(37)-C2)-methylthiotransferase MiaB [Dethiosulfatarculus sandiegensis]|uniref:tRNA-2-methylthio-N(6)-dimethylallyladenosine synthase n=1 Tax=Dethiosulfatarculus sandiegensis TaxID=1429043 RepID=A0A0D2GE16_9BACT|nr:tRNA (N6-isopentenyl adenosine(37)-C2)-methylthiotransferase MiaB [Dethiosulfatarculus sandiegensis]KIX13232.1 (dimethylallyl)adenosine tRNA methylthiotransferase [Dethiosulfatarculus sandiegensis]